MATLHVNKDQFLSQVLDYVSNPSSIKFMGSRPAVVDFYANWCGPCKMLAPIFEKLSNEYAGKVDFYKIDVDQEGALTADFNVQSIPSLFFFSTDGKIERAVGGMTEGQLRARIESLLK